MRFRVLTFLTFVSAMWAAEHSSAVPPVSSASTQPSISSPAPVSLEEYQARRNAIRKDIKGVLVAFGLTSNEEDQLRSSFLQESYFQYLTGWNEPDALLLMTAGEEELFLPPRNERYERYYGHKTSPTDPNAVAVTGFTKVLPRTQFEAELFRLTGVTNAIEVISAERQSSSLPGLFALRTPPSVEDATAKVNNRRELKSPTEIALIQRSVDASIAAHRSAISALRPGLFEYQIATTMESTWGNLGCQRPAYASIIGSGPNSVVLHYSANQRQMQSGDIVVIDAAAECNRYASDITRTLPVNGHFSQRQKEIYDVVLAAQQAAINAIKPGMVVGRKETSGSLMQIAYDYINSHGKGPQGEALGQYFVHGLSHHVGLDVHDPGPVTDVLKPGMIITIEPGVYIPAENLGVRIEDMVLVTETGGEVLTKQLPKSTEEIEHLMQPPPSPPQKRKR